MRLALSLLLISLFLVLPAGAELTEVILNPATDQVSGELEVTCCALSPASDYSEILMEVDGDTSTTRPLDPGDPFSLTWNTMDLQNRDHDLVFILTDQDGQLTRETTTITVDNDVRIILHDAPEVANGFLIFSAEVQDEFLDATNVWYLIDTDPGIILPHAGGGRFPLIIDITDLAAGEHVFTVKAIDVNLKATTRNVSIEVDPTATTLVAQPPADRHEDGANGTYSLLVYASGADADADRVGYRIDGGDWAYLPRIAPNSFASLLSTSDLQKGDHALEVAILDASGNEVMTEALAIQGSREETSQVALIVFAALAIAILIALSVLILFRHQQRLPPEDIFLMAEGGILIRHFGPEDDPKRADRKGKRVEGADKDLVSSMLVAIQDFVRVSFAPEGRASDLKQIAFGERTILMERGPGVILALVVPGVPGKLDLPFYERHMLKVLDRLMANSGDRLRVWDGRADDLEAIDADLRSGFEV